MKLYEDITTSAEKLKKEMGGRLLEAIKKSKYTQEAFAEACGISYPSLRSYILGKHFYRVDVLLKASKLLKVSPEYLLCQKEEEVEPVKKFENETHFKAKASEQMLSLIAKDDLCSYNEATHIIRALDNLIENEEVLKALANYFWYARNKNVNWGSSCDKKEYEFLSNEKEHFYRLGIDDMRKIFLYELIKAMDNVEQKLSNRNLQRKEM